MLIIPCPWCGPRDEIEFHCGGEIIGRPHEPCLEVGDEAWGQYLFFRDNKQGMARERWLHLYGCRQWFEVSRNTVTHAISSVHHISDALRAVDGLSIEP